MSLNFFSSARRTVRQWIVASLAVLVFASVPFSPQGGAEPRIPVITIHAKRYEFKPAEITLKAGQKVRLVFLTDDVTHSVVVNGIGIDLPIWKNRSNEVVITPHQTGDFTGECSRYCGIGHDRMTFTVHVTR